jgi:hypothetical protein
VLHTFRLPILTTPILTAMMFLVGTAPMNVTLAQTAAPSWEESLSSQYPKGTVLNVLTTGVVGTTACNVHAFSTFKDGKLHAPGFAQNLGLAAVKCELHPIAPGTQVYLGEMKVYQKNNKVAFAVLKCSVADCSGGVEGAASSQVDFEFPKGFLATAQLSQVQESIRHVFSIASAANAPAEGGQVAPAVSQPAPPQLSPTVTPGSLYVNAQNKADRLQLNLDNSFSLQEGGQPFTGSYSVAGATLKLHIVQLQKDVDIVAKGNEMVVNGEEIWALAVGPLYVNSANSADKLQLRPDGSFTLQEGGQAFTGTYTVAGATLKLHIAQLQKDVDIAIQGNRLIVNGDESWVSPESANANLRSPDGVVSDQAKPVLFRAVQFEGGIDNIRAIKDLEIRFQETMNSPQGAIDLQIHQIHVYPSIIRSEVKYSLGKRAQELTTFFDGTNGWRVTNGTPTEMNEAQEKEAREAIFHDLLNLLSLIGSPNVTYEAKSGENDVLLFGLGDASVRLHIDPTGQVVKLAYRGPTGDIEETLRDYREVGGLKIPYKLSSTRNGQKYQDAQITEVTANTSPSLERLAQKPR